MLFCVAQVTVPPILLISVGLSGPCIKNLKTSPHSSYTRHPSDSDRHHLVMVAYILGLKGTAT